MQFLPFFAGEFKEYLPVLKFVIILLTVEYVMPVISLISFYVIQEELQYSFIIVLYSKLLQFFRNTTNLFFYLFFLIFVFLIPNHFLPTFAAS